MSSIKTIRYYKFNCKVQLNINTRISVEYSLENTFGKLNNSKIENYSYLLVKKACFHYQAKTKDNKLEIGLFGGFAIEKEETLKKIKNELI